MVAAAAICKRDKIPYKYSRLTQPCAEKDIKEFCISHTHTTNWFGFGEKNRAAKFDKELTAI